MFFYFSDENCVLRVNSVYQIRSVTEYQIRSVAGYIDKQSDCVGMCTCAWTRLQVLSMFFNTLFVSVSPCICVVSMCEMQ